jgi:plasmid segregation protein ParM
MRQLPSVAYPSSADTSAMPAAEKRKTVCIPVGSLFYEVGPDITWPRTPREAAARRVHRVAGVHGAAARALSMKVPHIDLLVVGLPVALLALKKAALEKAMTGSHEIAAGRTLTVGKALAVAQPQGALVHYAAEHEKMASIGTEQSLVIDPGSRTFDWLVCRGMRLVQKQSHSINRGMSDVLRLMAAEISKDIGTPTATTTPSTSPCAPARRR